MSSSFQLGLCFSFISLAPFLGYRQSSGHDSFSESLLQTGSYTKLYSFTSFTPLLNGLAIDVKAEEKTQVSIAVRIYTTIIDSPKFLTKSANQGNLPSRKNSYTCVEIVLQGNGKHVVRVPIVVYGTSSIWS